jgi:drug/metabolite transporter (DMT)-like permease
MSTTLSNERRGIFLVIGAALLWSTGGIGIKAIAENALYVSCYRSAIAAVALFLIFRPRAIRWTPWFVTSIVAYAGTLIAFVTATKWTTAANAIFLQYSGVVWVLLLSPIVLKEKLKWRDAVAIAVAIAGMGLFFVQQFEARGLAGNLMALLSSAFFALLVISLRLQRGSVAEAAVTWGNVLTAAIVFPFIARAPAVSARSLAVLAFLGIFQIAIAYALFVNGLKYISATEASLTGMIEPVANPIWVFFLLGERPHALSLVGGAIVLAAIVWRTVAGGREVAVALPPPD